MRHLAKGMPLAFVIIAICSCQMPMSKRFLVGKWRNTKTILNQKTVYEYPDIELYYYEFYANGQFIRRYDDNKNRVFDEDEIKTTSYQISGNTLLVKFLPLWTHEAKIDYIFGHPVPGCGRKRLRYKLVDPEGNIIEREFRNIK